MNKFLKKVFDSFAKENKDLDYDKFVKKIRESLDIGKTKEKLDVLSEAWKKKRRGEEVKESFEDIETTFMALVGSLIESDEAEIIESYTKEAFVKEILDKHTEYGKTEDVFTIKLKENREFHNFVYFKKWWKPRFTESFPVEEFIISTSKNINFNINSNIMNEKLEGAHFHVMSKKDFFSAVGKDIEYLPPKSSVLNESLIPYWSKLLDTGVICIKESENEIILEIQGTQFQGKLKATRPDKNSDFWNLCKLC